MRHPAAIEACRCSEETNETPGHYLTLGQTRYKFGNAVAAVEGMVQKLLGHKSAVLTLDRCGHLFPDDLDAVATAFDTASQSAADQLRTGPQLKIAAAGPRTL